jgi:hypothetical protein
MAEREAAFRAIEEDGQVTRFCRALSLNPGPAGEADSGGGGH